MILWIDDVRVPPNNRDYEWAHSTIEALEMICDREEDVFDNPDMFFPYEYIDIDHDAGDYASNGGDFINVLNWLERNGRNYPVRIHSMNPVGIENMRRIIYRNGWKEIL